MGAAVSEQFPGQVRSGQGRSGQVSSYQAEVARQQHSVPCPHLPLCTMGPCKAQLSHSSQ